MGYRGRADPGPAGSASGPNTSALCAALAREGNAGCDSGTCPGRFSLQNAQHALTACACWPAAQGLIVATTETNLDIETVSAAPAQCVLAGQRGGGCEIRTREGLPPTRLPTLLASVHHGPSPFVTCPDVPAVAGGEQSRTGVNETQTEPRPRAGIGTAARFRAVPDEHGGSGQPRPNAHRRHPHHPRQASIGACADGWGEAQPRRKASCNLRPGGGQRRPVATITDGERIRRQRATRPAADRGIGRCRIAGSRTGRRPYRLVMHGSPPDGLRPIGARAGGYRRPGAGRRLFDHASGRGRHPLVGAPVAVGQRQGRRSVLPVIQDERGGVIAGERVHDVNGPARRSRAGLVFRVSR